MPEVSLLSGAKTRGKKAEVVPPAIESPEPVATPTPEELAAKAQEFARATDETMWGKKPEAIAEPVPAPVAEPVEAPPAEPPAAEPEMEPVAPSTPPLEPEPPELSASQLIERTAERTGRAVAEAIRDTKPLAEAGAIEELPANLTPDDAEDLRVAAFLEAKDPKFAGKREELKQFIKDHYEYVENWAKENPDKDYEQDDAEHKEWYRKNQPAIDRDTLDKGRIRMLVAEGVEETLRPEREQKKASEAFEKALPAIRQTIAQDGLALVDAVDPELAKLLKDDQGQPVLTKESFTKLEESDPIAAKVLGEAFSNFLGPAIMELETAAVEGMNYKLDPAKNQVHAKIDHYRQQAEEDLRRAKPDQRLREGKEFLSLKDRNEMRQAIDQSKATPAEKQQRVAMMDNRYWWLTIDDLKEIIIDDVAKKAKALIADTDALAKKKYYKNGLPAPITPPAPLPPIARAPLPAALKPKPPSLSSQSEVTVTPNSGTIPQKSPGEQAAAVAFR